MRASDHNRFMKPLLQASVAGRGPTHQGKVRDIFDLGSELLLVSTDRISAFDVVMANGIPDKGRVLNQLSAFWFERLSSVCRNHVVSTSDEDIRRRVPGAGPDLLGRSMIVRKSQPLMVECVARGYLVGSLYKEYVSQGGRLHGLDLPPNIPEAGQLDAPIFTPATKATDGHDQNISFDEMAEIVGRDLATNLRDLTLRLFALASEYCAERGLILADTKFEFGIDDEGLVWIDEALTPDSSRYWDAARYQPGGPQPSFDKQFVRDYLESIQWDKRPPGPELPEDIVRQTRDKYLEAFQRITGRPLAMPVGA